MEIQTEIYSSMLTSIVSRMATGHQLVFIHVKKRLHQSCPQRFLNEIYQASAAAELAS
jgi:hypothetical protein